MRFVSFKKLPWRIALLLLLLLNWPQLAVAESAISCHCFRDRTYNPAARFAADKYILATTFNSLIARFFGLPKREVVMLKMQGGVGQNDLLTGLQIAADTGADLKELLTKRKGNQQWQTIIADPAMALADSNAPLLEAIRAGNTPQQAGRMVADSMLVDLFEISLKKISALRASGLDEKEIALLLILAKTSQQSLPHLAALHAEGERAWSEIAHNLGIEAVEAGKLILAYKRVGS